MTAAAIDVRTMVTDALERLRCLEASSYAMLSVAYGQATSRLAELQIRRWTPRRAAYLLMNYRSAGCLLKRYEIDNEWLTLRVMPTGFPRLLRLPLCHPAY